MIKVVLATWCKMNGDNESWTVAWRLVFKLILSLRQFSGQDSQSRREGQITERGENKWIERGERTEERAVVGKK